MLDAMGREVGKEVVHVATNLRDNTEFAGLDWGMFTHISVIAAIAYTLAPTQARVFVASSDVPPPWGS
ncbi:MAG: hypothetical protein ABF665_04460 [Gluconacetobacter sp.]